MNDAIYPIAVIGVIALVTWALRAFPFLLFGSRPLPKTVQYLGRALPGSLWYSGAYCLCAGRDPPDRAQEYVFINCRRDPMLYDLNQGNVTSRLISRSGLPSPAVLPTARCGARLGRYGGLYR